MGDAMAAKGTLIAEGLYALERGETTTGRETWQLVKLAHGGMQFASRAETTQPKAMAWTFTYEITQRWAPLSFTIRLDNQGRDITSEQRAAGSQWLAHAEPRGESARDHAVPFAPHHAIEFPSPLFRAVSLVRLNLQVGQSTEVDAVDIDGTTLEPRAARHQYACVAEESIETPAGKFSAWHYTLRVEAEPETHFWADRHGTLLLWQAADSHVAKLTRYRRIERR